MDSVSKKRVQQNNLTSTIDAYYATRYNERNDTDKENYVMDGVANKTLESIGTFSVEWAVFEDSYFGRHCSLSAIMERISKDTILSGELMSVCEQFRDVLIQYAGGNESEVISRLKFRSSERNAKKAVADWVHNDKCTYAAPIAVIYRIRCNMFHGEKMVYMLDGQQELFDMASRVIDKYIEMKDLLPVVRKQAALYR